MEMESDIVADSEGEDEYFPVRHIGTPATTKKIQRPTLNDCVPVSGLRQGDTSHISEYTDKPSSHIESISVFTNKPQTSSHPIPEIPSDPPKPQRPRPRPLYKMKQQAPSISDISGGDSSFAGSILNIADRAKMRSRAPKPAESGPVYSESPVASVISLGVIDISSDDDSDELNSLPKSKPKARKGKEISKPQKKVRKNVIESPEHSPTQPISPASKNPSSSFLPNDEMVPHYDHPTIATLIEPNTSPRGSSPLPSLQKEHVIEDEDVRDQLDSDMPPPAIFTSSSLGPDKPAEDHFHKDDISPLNAPMSSPKDKPVKKGRKKDTRKNENETEPKGKIRSKGKKTKEAKAGAAAKKGKGKGKEKEVFKSSEFVDDDSIQNPQPFSVLDEPSVLPDRMDLSSAPPTAVEDPIVRSKTGRKRKDSANDETGGKTGKTSKKRKTENAGKTSQSKAKAKMVVLSDDEDTSEHLNAPVRPHPNEEDMEVEETERQTRIKTGPGTIDGETEKESTKENIQPNPSRVEDATQDLDTPKAKNPSLTSRYSIAPRYKSTPMSELIRRVNSLPSSPFPVGRPGRSIHGTAYSPYLKSNKAALSRIAPLHPNRRTPPPPLPPPPPPKKTKKEKEREEQWEEELIEEVGGMTEWVSMTDVERSNMRRMKREREMGGWED